MPTFEECIADGVATGAMTPEIGAAAAETYRDAFAEAAQTLSPQDADRAAGQQVLSALQKAKIEALRQQTLMIRTRRALLEELAAFKEARGYKDVSPLGGAGGQPPKGGWVQGGTPPIDGPFKGRGARAAQFLQLVMRNRGGLSGKERPGVEDARDAIRGLFDSKMAGIMEKFEQRLGAFSRNRALMVNIVREAFGEDTGDASAKELASAWTERAELSRRMFNGAGGMIGKLDKWGLPQAHNAAAVYRAGKEAWIQFTVARLDRTKMIDKLTQAPFTEQRLVAKNGVLSQIYDRIVTHGLIDAKPSEHVGAMSLAMSRGEERFLTFKNADAWMEYQKAFGAADAYSAMMGHLDDMARDTALMQVLGPNPEHQWGWLTDFARREFVVEHGVGRVESAERQGKAYLNTAQNMYDAYSGKLSEPVDERLARLGANTRGVLNSAELGAAILSDMPSAPMFGAMARSFSGIKLQGDMGQLVRLLADPAMRRDARRLGFINEVARDGLITTTQDSLRMMTAGEKAGQGMNALARKLPAMNMRLSGLSGAFEARRRSFRMSFMATLQDASDKSLAQLAQSEVGPERALAGELAARGFSEADWSAIRATPAWEPRPNVKFLRPSDIAEHAGPELGIRVGSMVLNNEQFAVPVAGTLWSRATLLGRDPPGTFRGELMRSLIMYRTFVTNAVHLYGEELFLRQVAAGHGYYGSRGWMTAWAAGMFGMATLAGALSMQLKNLSNGRDAQPMNTPQFWGAAMLQGGGLGILGDFFFSRTARTDQTAPVVAAGPVGGLLADVKSATVDEAFDALHRSQHPSSRAHDHEAARIAHDLAAYVPFSSTWWARAAYDRAIVDQLQMAMDPDAKAAFARAQRQSQSQTGAGAWWPRGSVTPQRAPDLATAAGAPPP